MDHKWRNAKELTLSITFQKRTKKLLNVLITTQNDLEMTENELIRHHKFC